MNEGTVSERATREKEQYNQGLQRGTYNRVLSHARYFFDQRREAIITEAIQFGDGKDVLEIGSHCWSTWFDPAGTTPERLDCINISEVELKKGVEKSRTSRLAPEFHIMDAHNLSFPDNSFDLVYGGAILHHLDFTVALDEIYRVLKSGGEIVFVEPLGINPISHIVRLMTPKARTEDEQPLRFIELRELDKRFDIQLHHEQFLSVPLGVVSYFLFKTPDNAMMRLAYRLDLSLLRLLPPLRHLFRSVVITGQKR